jgi:hypothetical protein
MRQDHGHQLALHHALPNPNTLRTVPGPLDGAALEPAQLASAAVGRGLRQTGATVAVHLQSGWPTATASLRRCDVGCDARRAYEQVR